VTAPIGSARAAAFCPGHVTGFFSIHDEDPDPLRRGSRGAGFSLAQGVLTYVEIAPADSLEIQISLDKEEQEAPVTREALTNVLRAAVKDGKVPLNKDAPKGSKARIAVRAWSDVHLPVSQGFGMSAAGALSAAMALAKALRMGRSEALRAAHAADVTQRGGLGDVVGASLGGFEMRTAPGLPPYGSLTNFVGYGDAVLCVLGGELETKSVLTDPPKRAAISAAGGRHLAEFKKSATLDAFLAHSQAFAREAGLLSAEMERAILAAKPYGVASMSMLGNSLFAFGNVPKLVETFERFGETRVVPVSEAGARIVEIEPAR
jgi:pantoate kinase